MPVPSDPTPNFVPGTLADADQVDARFKKLYDTLDPAVSGVDESNVRTGGLWTASAAMPASPRDGQECYVLADAANSIVWHMRYRAAVGRWEFVGGEPLTARVDTAEVLALALNTWGDPATGGPDVTIPIAGDYNLAFGADLIVGANGQQVQSAVAIGAAGTPAAGARMIQALAQAAQARATVAMTDRFTGLSVGNVLRMRYRVQAVGGGSPTATFRWLKVWPWRL